MVEVTNDLIYEVLKRLQEDVSDVKGQMRTMNTRMSSVESHIAAFHGTVASHSHDLDELRGRIERIERRLDLHDA